MPPSASSRLRGNAVGGQCRWAKCTVTSPLACSHQLAPRSAPRLLRVYISAIPVVDIRPAVPSPFAPSPPLQSPRCRLPARPHYRRSAQQGSSCFRSTARAYTRRGGGPRAPSWCGERRMLAQYICKCYLTPCSCLRCSWQTRLDHARLLQLALVVTRAVSRMLPMSRPNANAHLRIMTPVLGHMCRSEMCQSAAITGLRCRR